MKNLMNLKKTILACAVISSIGAGVVRADDWDEEDDSQSVTTYKQEKTYTGGGALIGAAVGGPPGLVVGAIIGSISGRSAGMEQDLKTRERALQKREQELAALQQQLAMEKSRVAELGKKHQEEKRIMLASLGNVSLAGQGDMERLLEENIQLSVQFRTGSEQLESHFEQRLVKLSGLLKQVKRLRVHLQGFADERGSSRKNEQLSRKRVEAVKALLVKEGVPADRIDITAWGEKGNLGLGKDFESYSFDRRVLISFSRTGGAS